MENKCDKCNQDNGGIFLLPEINQQELCTRCAKPFEFDQSYNEMQNYYLHLIRVNNEFRSIDVQVLPGNLKSSTKILQFDIDSDHDCLCHKCFFELELKEKYKIFIELLWHGSVKEFPEDILFDILKLSRPQRTFY